MHQIMPWSQKNVQNDHGIFQRLFFFIKKCSMTMENANVIFRKTQNVHGNFERRF